MSDQPKSAGWLICDGLCVTAAEIGIPGYPDAVAYPHPGCPVHDPDVICQCGSPDRCLSPTHGQISLREALEIRHRQSRPEQRPDDDPAPIPVCEGRSCGGRPHE